jgi:hypothetical protein
MKQLTQRFLLASFIAFGVLWANSALAQMPEAPSSNDPAAIKMYQAKKLRWSIAHPEEYQAMQKSAPSTEKLAVSAPPVYPKFLSYPTSQDMPRKIDSGNASEDQLLYDLRVQHWYFLFDQNGYVAKYGPLPTHLPGGVTPKEYAKNPPSRAISADLERKFAEMSDAESPPTTEE